MITLITGDGSIELDIFYLSSSVARTCTVYISQLNYQESKRSGLDHQCPDTVAVRRKRVESVVQDEVVYRGSDLSLPRWVQIQLNRITPRQKTNLRSPIDAQTIILDGNISKFPPKRNRLVASR